MDSSSGSISCSPALPPRDSWADGKRVNPEVHIAGIVVHVTPHRLAQASAAIAALRGAELHATDHKGKLVFTLEAGSSTEIAAQLEAIQGIDGVLGAFV